MLRPVIPALLGALAALLAAPSAAHAQARFRLTVGGTAAEIEDRDSSANGLLFAGLSFDMTRQGRAALGGGTPFVYTEGGFNLDGSYGAFGAGLRFTAPRGRLFYGAAVGYYVVDAQESFEDFSEDVTRRTAGGRVFAGVQGSGSLFAEASLTFGLAERALRTAPALALGVKF